MPKEMTLSAELRERTGSTSSSALRHAGKIPGVLYGHGAQVLPVALDARNFEELLHQGARSSLITIRIDGKAGETALIREIQRDPVTRKIVHADLLRVSANEEITTRVPISTVGTPLGVREFGGVLDVVVHELEITGPANKLPDRIEIDVHDLGIHQHTIASEVQLPSGFQLVTPPDTILVSVEPSKTAAQLEEAAPAAVEPEPELVGTEPAEPPPGSEPPQS